MTMLYLCRHAIAADATGELPDAQRPLTPEGMRKFRKGARGLVAFVGAKAIGHILTSPLLRARQTAEILAEVLTEHHRAAAVAATEALGPEGRIEALVKEVRGFRGEA